MLTIFSQLELYSLYFIECNRWVDNANIFQLVIAGLKSNLTRHTYFHVTES